MKKIILIAVIVVASAVFAVGVRAEGIKEGKWEFTMTTKMEGMGEEYDKAMKEMENMPPEQAAMMKQMMGNMNMQMDAGSQGITTTHTQCISNQNPVPSVDDTENCQQTHSIDGNAINFEVVCDKSSSTGHVTYNDETMEGQIQSHQMADGKDVNATIEITGQYVGPCS